MCDLMLNCVVLCQGFVHVCGYWSATVSSLTLGRTALFSHTQTLVLWGSRRVSEWVRRFRRVWPIYWRVTRSRFSSRDPQIFWSLRFSTSRACGSGGAQHAQAGVLRWPAGMRLTAIPLRLTRARKRRMKMISQRTSPLNVCTHNNIQAYS